jgi:predicted nucleic-acid-binding Zn-ribbon protein
MPDEQGKLSEQEQKLASDWLTSRVKNWICPCCETNSWLLSDVVSSVSSHPDIGVFGKRKVTPFVQLVCSNCGYTRIHNAVLMGIVPKSSVEDVKSVSTDEALAKDD